MTSDAGAALAPEQAKARLGQLKGWEIADGKKLTKSYRFENFVQAVDFVNKITPIAEQQGHHPDLLVRWGEVRVELWTHTANGVTPADFTLAQKIDGITKS